jgi:hypothetical protein
MKATRSGAVRMDVMQAKIHPSNYVQLLDSRLSQHDLEDLENRLFDPSDRRIWMVKVR